jgi:hypothetical protein
MPYRALLWTIMTVALALLAVGMWTRAVGPLMEGADAAAVTNGGTTQPAKIEPSTKPAPTRPAAVGSEQNLRRLVHGTLLLSFVLICMLLIVGLAGSFREWVRFRTMGAGRIRAKADKTKYVDAWKIAGQRMPSDGGKKDDSESIE